MDAVDPAKVVSVCCPRLAQEMLDNKRRA